MDLYAGSERPPLFLSSQSHSSVIDKCRAECASRLGKNSRGPRIRRVYDSSMTNRTYKLGQSRDQASFLPPCLEDYVDRDNPVRAIDAYVDALDLNELGFRDVGSDGGAGQPPYDPADLLKLSLYGYLHQVRSSRRLEREAQRNVELMWLLRGLAPGYRTIANFRKDNATGLKAANRDFVLLARRLDLLGGALVAIDGAFFHGDASKASILTKKRLHEQMAALDRSIAEYNAALEANDKAEEAAAAAGAPRKPPSGEDIAQKLAALRQRRAAATADLAKLAASGDGQISRTDPDARLLAKHGQIVAGYNVQIAVDDKHKLIVASEVVNEGNDTGQLHAMAAAAKAALGVEALTAVADAGYFNGETLKACEEAAITALCSAARSRPATESAGSVQCRGVPLRRRGRCLSLSGRRGAAADARAKASSQRQDGDPLCQPSLGLPGVSVARALPGRQGRAARDRTLGG